MPCAPRMEWNYLMEPPFLNNVTATWRDPLIRQVLDIRANQIFWMDTNTFGSLRVACLDDTCLRRRGGASAAAHVQVLCEGQNCLIRF